MKKTKKKKKRKPITDEPTEKEERQNRKTQKKNPKKKNKKKKQGRHQSEFCVLLLLSRIFFLQLYWARKFVPDRFKIRKDSERKFEGREVVNGRIKDDSEKITECMIFFIKCSARPVVFRSVQFDLELDCPRVHPVSLWDFVWIYGSEVGSIEKFAAPQEIVQVWKMFPGIWIDDGFGKANVVEFSVVPRS